jgi:hypothetical protein
MFQRNQTPHADAPKILNNLQRLDTRPHPANTLGAKTFTPLASNPLGPQRRVVVVKSKTGA